MPNAYNYRLRQSSAAVAGVNDLLVPVLIFLCFHNPIWAPFMGRRWIKAVAPLLVPGRWKLRRIQGSPTKVCCDIRIIPLDNHKGGW
jgi:hypothetical protein